MGIKEIVSNLWHLFIALILLYLICHLIVGMFKTIFCDVEVKLYRTLAKRLKNYTDDQEVEEILNLIERYKKY